jgi:hypothetical protein
MEYFLGSVLTLAVIFFVKKYFIKETKIKIPPIRFSQTRSLELSIDLIKSVTEEKPVPKTQATINYMHNTLRILILGKFAYWIKDNKFYVADLVDGDIDEDSTREVDIMSMDNVQLEKMMYIVEQLREGMPNDSRDSR